MAGTKVEIYLEPQRQPDGTNALNSKLSQFIANMAAFNQHVFVLMFASSIYINWRVICDVYFGLLLVNILWDIYHISYWISPCLGLYHNNASCVGHTILWAFHSAIFISPYT